MTVNNAKIEQIVRGGVLAARQYGLYRMTATDVSHFAEMSRPLMSYYLGGIDQIRFKVIEHALTDLDEYRDILAETILRKDDLVDCLTVEQKREILTKLV